MLLSSAVEVRRPSGTTYGQSRGFLDAGVRGRNLYNQGKYEEAVPFHREAVRHSEREFANRPTFATHLNNLAVLYRILGRYADAEPLFKRALSIFENVLPNHYEVAVTLENYADLLRATDRAGEAEKLETRADAIREKQAE